MQYFVTGQWDEAVVEVEASIELAAGTGESFGLLVGRSVLALISLHRNDIRRAAEAIGEYSGATTRFRSQWALWARALILEADGKTAEAYATLADCWDRCAELGLVLEYRMIGADLVRLALARADQGRARAVTARVTELAEQNPGIGSLAAAALRCRGLLDDDAGALRAAVDAFAAGARPLELALTAEEAGAALARRGLPGQARQLLDRATEIYERLGAARDLARADAVLRGAGIRRGRQAGGRRHVESPDRRPDVHLAPDGADAPRPRLRQARPHLPRPARRRGHPAGSALGRGWPAPRLLASPAGVMKRGNPARAAGRFACGPGRGLVRAAR